MSQNMVEAFREIVCLGQGHKCLHITHTTLAQSWISQQIFNLKLNNKNSS